MSKPHPYYMPLITLATHPNTRDKDAYARKARMTMRELMDVIPTNSDGINTILNGTMRLISRTEPVATNSHRLGIALDLISTLAGFQWRPDTYLKTDPPQLRFGYLFANPHIGARRSATVDPLDSFPDECTCVRLFDQTCYAPVHTV